MTELKYTCGCPVSRLSLYRPMFCPTHSNPIAPPPEVLAPASASAKLATSLAAANAGNNAEALSAAAEAIVLLNEGCKCK